MSENYERVFEVIEMIPVGKVATYGDIAALAGKPGAPRWAGQALSKLDAFRRLGWDVPWYRVINAQGRISVSGTAGTIQRNLLIAEGVEFTASGRIDLRRYRWRPKIRIQSLPRPNSEPDFEI